MAGLLDFLATPEAALGVGLLGAASSGRGFGGGLMDAVNYANGVKQNHEESALRKQYRDMQMQAMQQEQEQRAAAMAAAQRKQQSLPTLFKPNGFDWQTALAVGYSPDEVQKLAATPNAGQQEVARTIETMDAEGRPVTMQVDKFGRTVGEGLGKYQAPISINQGDRTTFLDATTLQPRQSFGINMSAAERDASSRGWASNALARQKLAYEMNGGADGLGGQAQFVQRFGKPSPGYRWRADGSMEAIPGGPADIKAGELGAKSEQRAEAARASAGNVLSAVSDARDLVGHTTAGVGSVFENVPGTDARNLHAKLETVKANLGFDRLQQMREMSPTGGALGAVAVQELTALQSTVASLDNKQSPAELRKSLNKVERHYNNWLQTVNGTTAQAQRRTPIQGAPRVPMRGQIVDGYRFKGGDPSDQANWELK